MTDDTFLPGLLRRRAIETPDKPFLRQVGGIDESYAQAWESVDRWAGILRRLGVGGGQFVAAMLPNCPTATHVWLGTNSVGAVEVPIHTAYRSRILAHALNTAGAEIAIVSTRYLDRFAEIVPRLTRLRTIVVPESGGHPGTLEAFDGVRVHQADGLPIGRAERLAQVPPGDPCTVLFTSGTTGLSKGVLLSYAQLRATTEGCWPTEDMSASDAYYCPLPPHHISGKIAIDSMLRRGGSVVLRERFKTGEFWSDITQTGSTCTCVMGAMAGFLLAEPARADDADNPLDRVLMLPLHPALEEFRARFGVRVRTVFNQTEISAPITSEGWQARTDGSCGRVRPGYECRIVDDNDEELPTGHTGELVVRAADPHLITGGYLGMPEETVKATRNMWWHTGDACRVDADGNYYFVDRIKDVIRRRGENISSAEVEAAVCGHPDVEECAAFAVPSHWTEDEVKIAVVLGTGRTLTAEHLLAFLDSELPTYMVPRFVEFVLELPKTETQKVRKTVLRATGVTATTWDRERTDWVGEPDKEEIS